MPAFLSSCRLALRFCSRLPLHLTVLSWRLLLLSFFLGALALLAARYVLAPQVAAQRERIEQVLSTELGRPVRIAALQASWRGVRPELRIHGVRVLDEEQRTALELPEVDAAIAWSSLWRWRPVLARLELVRPELEVRREADGRIFVAGLSLSDEGEGDGSAVTDFVLEQKRIVIRDARVSWHDALRNAPALTLEKLNFRLENNGDRHRFALLASPPAAYSANLDLRGDLYGRHLADWAQWSGQFYLSLDEADLAVWQQWVDYPLALPRGRGGLRAWLEFDGARVAKADVDVALAGVALRLTPDLPMLELASLQGRLSAARSGDEFDFSASRLSLATREGLRLGPTDVRLRYAEASDTQAAHGEFSSDALDVRVLAQLAGYLPLPEDAARRLTEAEPGGVVDSLALTWEGAAGRPAHFTLEARFRDLRLSPSGSLPGFSGLSGLVTGNEREGEFRVEGRKAALHAPHALHEADLPLDSLNLQGGWGHETAKVGEGERLTVRVDSFEFTNPDLGGDFSGLWQAGAGDPGYLEVSGEARNAQLASAWRYIPASSPHDVVAWLRDNLRGGQAQRMTLAIKGAPADFPFHNKPGVFRLKADFANGVIVNFAPGWPGMEALQGSFEIDRQRMTILAHRGRYLGAQAADVKVEIPDLMADGEQVLTVDGAAAGPTQDFLRYFSASTLAEHIGDFTRNARAQGEGRLSLHLTVPLHDSHHTRVKGDYRFTGNNLRLVSSLPDFANAGGTLAFDEHGISLPGVQAQFLGRRVSVTGLTEANGTVALQAEGGATIAALRQLLPSPLWDRLAGEAAATAQLRIGGERIGLQVRSRLVGVRSDLPTPLAKGVTEEWPFALDWEESGAKGENQRWQLSLGERLNMDWQERCATGGCQILRGALASGTSLKMPERGWSLNGSFGMLDTDVWRPVVEDLQSSFSGSGGGDGGLLQVGLRAQTLQSGGHRFERVDLSGQRQAGVWQLQLQGPDLAGRMAWYEAGAGRLEARLSRLSLQPLPKGFVPLADQNSQAREELPALDVQADSFRLHSMELGRLSLRAESVRGGWALRELRVQAPDMLLAGSGTWQRWGTDPGTSLAFELNSEDAGSMLARLGFPDTVRGGRLRFTGRVGWRGLPSELDYATLDGETHLEASQGQFLQMQPGTTGRLLGIMSLQSLPRRLTLDFRDIFSEGFAFDSIRGDTSLDDGVLSTKNLEIRGPAARVFLSGKTDLGHEQHDLLVRVQPTLSESVAVGVLVGQAALGVFNPAIGAAAYFAQKILQDPVEKIFSYDYTVSGSWADPHVERKMPANVQADPAAKQEEVHP
ncbi:MAG: TIGR02099 family protein [Candidatus Dactylopiibacterium carminicum]|uniref:TIGR02099 family protein n=1 Tax=Candidatus Dactylopiibacterium carminicum TaxID=857335 RepID=A0A272ETN6_9RHOO|nr:YhdP family protein [Candidatus Dactylopiibacterium carminicum]KAF7599390.1 TIGR02099 family protein [Candidatus Dactylopiibacterium carminicum]PAS93452.1 MAG: TIGR02099 family protein [Candidatus Dactylopiibacterium carminicum]PAS95971.1 MAG: TIGR02099 family protein [Candidatus Dactylopiibacterium carminicum]PAS99399.1 MAG: TIGR02099 family protein [Candidatus Dactylopiibacterium carminicum]